MPAILCPVIQTDLSVLLQKASAPPPEDFLKFSVSLFSFALMFELSFYFINCF